MVNNNTQINFESSITNIRNVEIFKFIQKYQAHQKHLELQANIDDHQKNINSRYKDYKLTTNNKIKYGYILGFECMISMVDENTK